MGETKTNQRLFSGKQVLGWLLSSLWLVAVFAGLAIVFTPSRYSVGTGWLLLTVAAVVFVATMDRWIKAFAGFIFLAALRAFSTIFIGHLPETPDKSIPIVNVNAIALTILFTASAWIILDLGERSLRLHHRLALLGFTCSLFWGMVDEPKTMLATIVGFALLAAVWGYAHFSERKPSPDPRHIDGDEPR